MRWTALLVFPHKNAKRCIFESNKKLESVIMKRKIYDAAFIVLLVNNGEGEGRSKA